MNTPLTQSSYLSTLARAPLDAVKAFADELIPSLEPIEVLQNRTGLVMVPMHDTAQGALFYVGEALIAEAHVRTPYAEGYAACLGRDLEQALAIALIDAALVGGVAVDAITAFVYHHARLLDEADLRLRQAVDGTRVEMETF